MQFKGIHGARTSTVERAEAEAIQIKGERLYKSRDKSIDSEGGGPAKIERAEARG